MASTIALLKTWNLGIAFLYSPHSPLVRDPISALSRKNLYRHNLASHNSLHTQKPVENQNKNGVKLKIQTSHRKTSK